VGPLPPVAAGLLSRGLLFALDRGVDERLVDPETPIEESIAAMAEFVEDGRVRSLGVSNVTPEQLRDAHAAHPIVAVQQGYSLLDRSPEMRDESGESLLDVCRELGISLVAYGPLGHGLLTGAIEEADDMDAGDFRHRLPRLQSGNIEHNAALAAKLREVAADIDLSPPQVAIAWLLHQDDDVVPIVGTRSVDHLDSHLTAADVELDGATLERLNEAIPPGAVKGSSTDPTSRSDAIHATP
jgi:aryl-alcohol dehydrogenase-like predicted oxidoreductase